jgi:hypothetical protein
MPARIGHPHRGYGIVAHGPAAQARPKLGRESILGRHAHLEWQRLQVKAALQPLHRPGNFNRRGSLRGRGLLSDARTGSTSGYHQFLVDQPLIRALDRAARDAELGCEIKPGR